MMNENFLKCSLMIVRDCDHAKLSVSNVEDVNWIVLKSVINLAMIDSYDTDCHSLCTFQ